MTNNSKNTNKAVLLSIGVKDKSIFNKKIDELMDGHVIDIDVLWLE